MSPITANKKALQSWTVERNTHCGNIYVTVTHDGRNPQGISIRFGKSGGCGSAVTSGLAGILGLAFQTGLDPAQAVKTLSGISCHLGGKTCMNEVAEAMRFVMLALETGRDINDLMDEEAERLLEEAAAEEEGIPFDELQFVEYGG